MDQQPTTEDAERRPDEPPVEPEAKSGVTLPLNVSQLRWKLGRKAKQEPKDENLYAHLQRLGLHQLTSSRPPANALR